MHQTTGAIITRRTRAGVIVATHYLETLRYRPDYSERNSEAHARAAMKLVAKLARAWCAKHRIVEQIQAPFCGQWVAGDMPSDDGFAFTYAGETDRQSGIEGRGFVQNCEGNPKA